MMVIRVLFCLFPLLLSVDFSQADTVWFDDFNSTGSPGTDQGWVAPWPTWTTEGITHFRGVTTTAEGDQFHCGTTCLTPSDSAEYSVFGTMQSPPDSGALWFLLQTGVTFGSSSGYIGNADFATQAVYLRDFDQTVGDTMVASKPFLLEYGSWYAVRQEADLSESRPWIRFKIWGLLEEEPVYWTLEGGGIGFHEGQHIILHGLDDLSTGVLQCDDVGVESQIAPRRVTSLVSAAAGADIQLTWDQPATADSASAYQGTSAFFTAVPGTEISGIQGGSYLVTGATGDPDDNLFFLVKGINESGESPPSNRVGEFDFAYEVP